MKKAIQLVALLLIVATLALPVSAAMTPSVQQKGAPATETKGVAVTAVADIEKAPAEVKAALEEAYKAIDVAKPLNEVVTNLDDTLKAMNATVKVENLVVRDVFYVAADTELKEGETKEVVFKAEGLAEGDFLVVMVFVDGQWVALDAENVVVGKDGEVKVTFDTLGPVAFVVEKA